MEKLVITKSKKDITGVFISEGLGVIGTDLEIEIINFDKVLTPWDEKTLELIEQSILVQIA